MGALIRGALLALHCTDSHGHERSTHRLFVPLMRVRSLLLLLETGCPDIKILVSPWAE